MSPGSAARDRLFMERALLLAERGRGRTTPNPLVGAVVVSEDGVVVGQGAHLAAGGPHAEIVALDEAGGRARGATLYCTLEPCSHTGRTGPCAVRIADAGVRRVVAAIRDPNPLVSGQGFEYLKTHGVDVDDGPCAAEAARQNQPFLMWITERRPFVTLKAATSADGFVGADDRRIMLTGAEADRLFHRQRAEIDAIAVGSGTVLQDDPRLTPRGAYRYRPLVRVVFDWRGRVPADARLFSTLDTGPVIMIVSARSVADAPERFDALARRGVIVHQAARRDVRDALTMLAAREVTSLLVEGGPTLHTAFADAGLVDRVQWIVTPRRLGDGVRVAPVIVSTSASTSDVVEGVGRRDVEGASDGRRRSMTLGDDILIEFDVHGTDRSNWTH